MKIKILYNRLLWLLGLRELLPAYYIRKIKIKESGEKLVLLENSQKVRLSVAKKIKEAEKYLPSGYKFFVEEGYRSPERQQEMWDVEYLKVKKNNPNLDEVEIERLTALKIARPGTNSGAHQTGGAIDVTIIDQNGNKLNMGTEIVEFNNKTSTKSKFLSVEERENRKILINALEKVGFNNYPAEWWHWSYGDKMWAAYKKKPYAFYGPIG